MTRWLRIAGRAFVLLLIIVVVVVGGAIVVLRHFQREWAPADVDVELTSKWPVLKAQDVPPGSAFDLLRRAGEPLAHMHRPADICEEANRLNVEPWSDASFPSESQALEHSAASLALARQAAIARNPQVPTRVSAMDPMWSFAPVTRIGELFRASAARKTAAGDLVGAYDELGSLIGLAQIVSRGGPLIYMLIEGGLEMTAAKAMRLIALQNDVPRGVANRAISRLLEADRNREPLAEVMRQEYHLLPGAVDMCFSPRNLSLFGIDDEMSESERRFRFLLLRSGWLFGSTRRSVTMDLTRVYKVLVKAADQPYSMHEFQRLEESVPRIRPVDEILMRDPNGYVLARLMLPGLLTGFRWYHKGTCDLRATVLVLAMRQFQEAQHRPPKDLQELIPEYLSEIPIDPFDGNPFRYRIRSDGQWVVYSVGPNQVDERGEQSDKEPRKYNDVGDLIYCECELTLAREQLSKTVSKP